MVKTRSSTEYEHIGWKRAEGYRHDDVIVVRLIKLGITGKTNEGRMVRICNRDYAKFRCSEAKVLEIVDWQGKEKTEAWSTYSGMPPVHYVVGKTVVPHGWNTDLDVICGGGIHYFTTKKAARQFRTRWERFHCGGKHGLVTCDECHWAM